MNAQNWPEASRARRRHPNCAQQAKRRKKAQLCLTTIAAKKMVGQNTTKAETRKGRERAGARKGGGEGGMGAMGGKWKEDAQPNGNNTSTSRRQLNMGALANLRFCRTAGTALHHEEKECPTPANTTSPALYSLWCTTIWKDWRVHVFEGPHIGAPCCALEEHIPSQTTVMPYLHHKTTCMRNLE